MEPVNKLKLGLDIGSVSLNTVIIDHHNNIIENHYDYCYGQPFNKLYDRLSDILSRINKNNIDLMGITGSGGKLASELLHTNYVNEIIAQSTAVSHFYPHVKSVIEMGGEDSKLLIMSREENAERTRLADFSMNGLCAAGTGSFLDQQAKRIGVSIEKEFSELALKSEKPPRIAGRCSVFAKSDMIHLQQIATPVHDIVAGLCFAVARNFKSNLAKGKDLVKPILFQGGVAANAGVVRAFKEILHVADGEFIIPEYHASMGAIGSVLYCNENIDNKDRTNISLNALREYLDADRTSTKGLPKLKESGTVYQKTIKEIPNGIARTPVYLGIDVGSLSTNVVLIDDERNVIARRYLPTASRPLDAIRRGLSEVYEEIGNKVQVMAAGTTGSGRYLTGDFIGADIIQNEITAQATAAIAFDQGVDTIFEIGGQDSKYISIEDSVIVDFEMNKVCAAGTGSFLEEQAEKLNINIKEEFGQMALDAGKPVSLGDRCTVFMESELNSEQQKGEKNDNLVAGLAYSIVYNYLRKVVGNKKIGNNIFFQGGVANNKGVIAAFENVTGKKITIPPHFDVTGAIGMAILARNYIKEKNTTTRFKGFEVRNVPFTLSRFVCKSCSNHCEIRSVKIEGEKKPLFYGGRCERYEVEERKNRGKGVPDLFKERLHLLTEGFDESMNEGRTIIGIPRALMVYYQQFPFWSTFFQALGFKVKVSRETDRELIADSLEMLTAETCFPVEAVHGHVKDLINQNVDYVFLPFIVDAVATKDNPTSNYNCPWIQSHPFMIKSSVRGTYNPDRLLIPTLHFRYYDTVFVKELSEFMKSKFGIQKNEVKRAIQRGLKKQNLFEGTVKEKGKEVLNNLPNDKTCLVILGRPYNTGDPNLNLRMVEKLINLDVFPIPLDYLPLEQANIFNDYNRMYWPNGQKIIAASRIIARHDRLHAVYMSNFRCGPDSFISHFVYEELKGKPYAHIEIDEHSADAGLITRFEAFLDSLKGYQKTKEHSVKILRPAKMDGMLQNERVLYFPYMNDGSYVIAAATRACGVESYSLPMQTQQDLDIGRRYTSSKECFPMICTTGSFIRKLKEPGVDPSRISFFMPDHNGPCRFGQYNKFQSIIYNRLGYYGVKNMSPANDTSYEEITKGNGKKFRINAWKGFVALDMLRKMKQEKRPYEIIQGNTDKVYRQSLDSLVMCIENGAAGLTSKLKKWAEDFRNIPVHNGKRKPVVAIVGEIFMRDNAFCNGFVIDRLEELGAETLISPFSEWFTYSTYRYQRDSIWKRDHKGMIKAVVQHAGQVLTGHSIIDSVKDSFDIDKEVEVKEMLELCNPYIGRDYDGDPPLAMGTAVALANKGISGIVNILPFTCMPGTILTAVANTFRKDHHNIPWIDIAYDGQVNTSNSTQLQAFMFQVKEYAKTNMPT